MIKDKEYFYNVRAVPDEKSVYWQRDSGRYLSRYSFVGDYVDGKSVLDIACGTGYGSALLVARGAAKVIGADVAEDAVEYARQNFSSENSNFITMSATNMDKIEDNSIDIVCSMGTIEHVDDVDKFIAEIKRVLVPGGKWFVSTLNKPLRNSKDLIMHHHHEYTLDEFSNLLQTKFCSVQMFGHRLNELGKEKKETNRRFTWIPLWVKRAVDKLSFARNIRQKIKMRDVPFCVSDYQWVTSDINKTCTEVIAICSASK